MIKLKRKKIFLWLRQQKCDIAFLQETYWTQDLEQTIYAQWNGQCVFNNGTNHSRGVAMLIRKGLELQIVNQTMTPPERLTPPKAKNDKRKSKIRKKKCEVLDIVNVFDNNNNNKKDLFSYSPLAFNIFCNCLKSQSFFFYTFVLCFCTLFTDFIFYINFIYLYVKVCIVFIVLQGPFVNQFIN